MDCTCGCGTRVPRKLIDANLQAASVALELLAWDKARAGGRIPREESESVDSLVDRGALQYRHLLGAIHGERESAPLAGGEAWLAESEEMRRHRQHMTQRRRILSKHGRLALTEEDVALLDRHHPDRSFSDAADRPAQPADQPSEEGDLTERLERLASLRTEGLLTEAEFRAAKQRLLG